MKLQENETGLVRWLESARSLERLLLELYGNRPSCPAPQRGGDIYRSESVLLPSRSIQGAKASASPTRPSLDPIDQWYRLVVGKSRPHRSSDQGVMRFLSK